MGTILSIINLAKKKSKVSLHECSDKKKHFDCNYRKLFRIITIKMVSFGKIVRMRSADEVAAADTRA